jgi:hypothetical protein
MIDSPTGIVLLGCNRNRVGSMGRGTCSYSRLIDTSAQIGATIGIMSLFTTVIALRSACCVSWVAWVLRTL